MVRKYLLGAVALTLFTAVISCASGEIAPPAESVGVNESPVQTSASTIGPPVSSRPTATSSQAPSVEPAPVTTPLPAISPTAVPTPRSTSTTVVVIETPAREETPVTASTSVPMPTAVVLPTATVEATVPQPTPVPELSLLECVVVGIAELGILYSQPPPPGGFTGPEPTTASYTTECDISVDRSEAVPLLVTNHYVPVDQVEQVSRFRSGAGHSFTDDFESCSSMKHYFRFFPNLDWTQVPVFSPFDGVVAMLSSEVLETGQAAGKQIWIVSEQNPSYYVIIFHAGELPTVKVGDSVKAGVQVAFHTGNLTWSDMSLEVITTTGVRNLPYMAALSPELFADFEARGATSPDDFILTTDYRAQNPLQCSGETFVGPPGVLGDPANFFVLN